MGKINFCGRKAKFSIRMLKISLRSRVINESSLRKLRGLIIFTWLIEGEDSYLPCSQRPLKQVCSSNYVAHVLPPAKRYQPGTLDNSENMMVDVGFNSTTHSNSEMMLVDEGAPTCGCGPVLCMACMSPSVDSEFY